MSDPTNTIRPERAGNDRNSWSETRRFNQIPDDEQDRRTPHSQSKRTTSQRDASLVNYGWGTAGRRTVLKAAVATVLLGTMNATGVAATGTGSGQPDEGDALWRFTADGFVESSPSVVDGTVYVGDEAGVLYAIDTETGDLRWSVETGEQLRTAAQVVDGTVYVGSTDHSVYAFDAETGTERWEFVTGSYVNSSPTTVGDTVYVGSEDNILYALDADDGTEQWRFEAGDMITNAPTVVGDTVYVGSRDQSVYALDADDGTERWSYRTDLWISSEVTVANGIAYVGSDDSTLYAFDTTDGTIEWQFTDPEAHLISATTVHDGVVYVASDDETYGSVDDPTPAVLYAVDAVDGELLWEFSVPVPDDPDEQEWQFHAAPTVVDGVVYIANVNGTVYGVDADNGDLTWEFETEDGVWSSPTVVDGVLYVGSDDEHLYAIDLETTASSEDSRVALGTLGHHDGWTGGNGTEKLSASIWADTFEPDPGQEVSISGFPSDGAITTFEWDAPQAENFPERGESISYTFEDEGAYAVTLRISDAGGQTETITSTFTVGDAVDSELSAGVWADTFEPDPGQEVSISGFPSDGAITAFEWDAPQAENFPESGESISYTFEDKGAYAVKLTVSDADGQTETITSTFTVGDAVDSELSAGVWADTFEPDLGQEVSISGFPSDGAITAFEWDAPQAENFPETGESINYTFEDAGTYEATLTVTDADGEMDSITSTFTVGALGENESEREEMADASDDGGTSDKDTETATDRDDEAISDSVPGLGIGSALAGLGGASYVLSRRGSDTETE